MQGRHQDRTRRCFNPHAREERDATWQDFLALREKVSIHTPVKGVTVQLEWFDGMAPFQSTRP